MQAHGDAAAHLEAARNIYALQLSTECCLVAVAHVACARNSRALSNRQQTNSLFSVARRSLHMAYSKGSAQEAGLLLEWAECMRVGSAAREKILQQALELMSRSLHARHPFVLHAADRLVEEKQAVGKKAAAELIRAQFSMLRGA
jgi:hypothetical protein